MSGYPGYPSGIVLHMRNPFNKNRKYRYKMNQEFLVSGRVVKRMDVMDATPLIDGVLPSNAVTVLSNSTGIRKDTIALDWAVHLVSRKDWYGHTVERLSNVVYITDRSWDFLGRCLRMWEKNHDGGRSDFVHFVNGVNQGIDMSMEGMDFRLVKELEYFDPDLIIFDSFSTLTNGELINDDEEVAKVFSRARNLIDELNTAVLFIHNDNSLFDYADAVITVNKVDNTGYSDDDDGDYVYLSTKKGDGGKQSGMTQQRILGFYIDPEGILSREDFDTRWVDDRIYDVKRATNLTISQKDRMVDILLNMKDIIETPWKQLIDSGSVEVE